MQTLREKRDNAKERVEAYRELSIEDRIKLVKERNQEKGGNSARELTRLNDLLNKPVKKKKNEPKRKNKKTD